jgi:hypothetical protein
MHAYQIIRWVVAVPVGLLGWWIIILNFAIAYRSLARREHHSWVPFLGGFLAFLGMGLCPLPRVQKFAWIPLLVDCGYVVANLTIGYGLMLARLVRGKKDDA